MPCGKDDASCSHVTDRRCRLPKILSDQGKIPCPVKAQFKSVKFCSETDLSSQFTDLICYMRDNFGQHIRSDMRLVGIHDVRIRPGIHKGLQNIPDPSLGILDACIQFSVGKCSRAAFTELHIGIRIRLRYIPFPEPVHRAGTLPRPLAALDQHRGEPGSCQEKSAEQACRACADDHHLSSAVR